MTKMTKEQILNGVKEQDWNNINLEEKSIKKDVLKTIKNNEEDIVDEAEVQKDGFGYFNKFERNSYDVNIQAKEIIDRLYKIKSVNYSPQVELQNILEVKVGILQQNKEIYLKDSQSANPIKKHSFVEKMRDTNINSYTSFGKWIETFKENDDFIEEILEIGAIKHFHNYHHSNYYRSFILKELVKPFMAKLEEDKGFKVSKVSNFEELKQDLLVE